MLFMIKTDFNIKTNKTMPRKKLPQGEKLKLLRVYVKEKYFDTFGEDELRDVADKSLAEHIELSKTKNSKK